MSGGESAEPGGYFDLNRKRGACCLQHAYGSEQEFSSSKEDCEHSFSLYLDLFRSVVRDQRIGPDRDNHRRASDCMVANCRATTR